MKNNIVIIWAVILLVLVGGLLWWQPWQAEAPADVASVPTVSEQESFDDNAIAIDTEEPSGQTPSAPNGEEGGEDEDTTTSTNQPIQQVTVTYTDSGFSPGTVTITPGSTVVFVNESTRDFWPASDVHPTHTQYSGTTRSEHCPDPQNIAFDSCGPIAPGGTYEFTFEKVGAWDYHDHLRAPQGGTVIVE